jgi:translocator protein
MSVLSQRSARLDLARSAAVVVMAVVQVVSAALSGSRQGAVAQQYDTPLLAAGWAFSIWGLIYLGFLAYAVYQVLPAQRGREIHRRTGWWAALTGVCNATWIVAFGADWILVAEILIVVLMVALAVIFGRLSREPAADVYERVLMRGPLALYAGWTSLALVLGTAATGVWAGLPGDNALAVIAAVVVLVAAIGIVSWVVFNGTAVVPYAAATVWALAGIALNDPPAPVVITGAIAIVVILVATLRRVGSAASPVRAAWG